MPSLSLYRKYRPQKFSEIIGQPAVTQTLLNAIKNDRISHAYLFTGPRGTGKTSTAKVLAMAVNCQDESSDEPCGECEACKRIKTGSSIDVIEIDAASNRGIDEIRELREKVKFYPGEGKYKVYIIDEVHMLTTGAFNALLKTLEEPPENVIFVLATTEPHKVIPTIMSRCQRFDFSLISEKEIEKHLEYICKEEGLDYELSALNLIAKSSEGGLRDALSILDQAVSYTGENIETEIIEKMLGRTSSEELREILLNLKDDDTKKAINLVNDILNEGKDVDRLIEDLKEYCNQALLIKECGIKTNLVKLPKERLKKMEKLAGKFSLSQLVNFVDILNEIKKEISLGGSSRINLEVGIFKLSDKIKEVNLQNEVNRLKGKINKIENKLSDKKFIEESFDKNEENNLQNNHSTEQKQNLKEKGTEEKKDEKILKETNKQKKTKKLSLKEVKNNWQKLLASIKNEDISLHAIVVESIPIKVENKKIYIKFPTDKNFHRKRAKEKKEFIEKYFKKFFNQDCKLKIVTSKDEKKENRDGSAKKNNKEKNDNSGEVTAEKVAELFNGKIIKTNPDIISNK